MQPVKRLEIIVCAIAATGFAGFVFGIVALGHGSPESMTLATALVSVGVGAATHIRTMILNDANKKELKADIGDCTEKTVTFGIEAVKAANGLSDRRAEENKAAGVAEGQAKLIAKVAEKAPEAAPVVAKAAAEIMTILSVDKEKAVVDAAFDAGRLVGREDSKNG